MAYSWFRPKPDAFGGRPVILATPPYGGGSTNFLGAATPLVSGGSTTIFIPAPYRKLYVRKISVFQSSLVASGGTTVVTVSKLKTGSAYALTAAYDLQDTTKNVANVVSAIGIGTAVVDSDRLVGEGDILQAVVSNAATISVQPTALMFMVEGLQIE